MRLQSQITGSPYRRRKSTKHTIEQLQFHGALGEIAVCKHCNTTRPIFTISDDGGVDVRLRGWQVDVKHNHKPQHLYFQHKECFRADLAILTTGGPEIIEILGFITHLEYACFGDRLGWMKTGNEYGVEVQRLLDLELLHLFVETTERSVYRARFGLPIEQEAA